MTSVDYSSATDQSLIALIAEQQDKLALAELYERYRHNLAGFIRRKLFQDRLVDEVFNDVMFTVWQKASAFRSESKVSTWIFGIAYRTCLTHLRKESKHQIETANDELENLSYEDSSETNQELKTAMNELSEQHQDVIELAYFYGHSMIEMSEILACPVNTVKTRLFHARKQLRQSVEKLQSQR